MDRSIESTKREAVSISESVRGWWEIRDACRLRIRDERSTAIPMDEAPHSIEL
jgi:hypothetical protein